MTEDAGAGGDEVGSLGEEAARLWGALAGWAGDSTDGPFHRWDEHLATGGSDCRLCPICRTVHVLRAAGPDVRDQLATAAASLLQAAAGLLAAAAADPPTGPTTSPTTGPTTGRPTDRPRPSRVQRIDLDDGDPGDGGSAGREGPR